MIKNSKYFLLFLILINLIFSAAPAITLLTPENYSTVSIDPLLNVTVTDGDSDVMNITFLRGGGKLFASKDTNYVVLTNGSVLAWGDNSYSQLGDGTQTDRRTPVYVNYTGLFSSVAGGTAVGAIEGHACGILINGSMICWGYDNYGQLGNGAVSGTQSYPTYVNYSGTFIDATAGRMHTCGILSDGTALCWGYNTGSGCLGDGTTTNRPNPVLVDTSNKFISISTNAYHTCGLLTNNSAMCWGYDNYGQAGDGGGATYRQSPVMVTVADNFVSLEVGMYHTCGLFANGSVACWGYNSGGQLGDGTKTTSAAAVFANTSGTFKSISAGAYHTCGVLTNGSAMCWGENNNRQMGDGTTTDATNPIYMNLDSEVALMSAGLYHTCAMLTNGSILCWGENNNGQLGDNSVTDRSSPVYVQNWPSDFATPSRIHNETNVASGTNVSYTWTGLQEYSTYLWRVSAFDGTTTTYSQVWSFTTLDSTSPTFTDISNITQEYAEALSYQANATDANGISCFTVNDTTNFQIDCTGILENKTGLAMQEYFLNVSINDTSNNNNSILIWVNVTDTAVPVFTDIANHSLGYGTALAYDINATDSANVSCFSVNDTANFQINCSGYLENISLLPVAVYYLNISVNDTSNNTDTILIWVNMTDTISPFISLDYPTEGLNLTSNVSIDLNFTVNDSGTGINTSSCTYSLDGGTAVEIPNCANTSFNVSSNVYGLHNISITVNDNVSNSNTSALINFTIANIFGNASNITSTGFSNLSVTINDNSTVVNTGLNNVSTVNISESGIEILIFDYNFTASTINFSNIILETGISSSKAYMSVSGINSTNIVNGKTFYLYNASTSYTEVCIRDEENITYANITSTCTGTNEYSVTCDGTLQNGYNCTMSGTNMTISGLNNSAIIQFVTPTTSSTSSSSSSNPKPSVSTEISQECSENKNAVTIRITYDSSGVKGLSVTLLGLEGIAFSSQKTTNSNGEAVFKISESGDYRIITSESSIYSSLSENINLNLLDCGTEEPECTEDSDCLESEYCLDEECIEIEQGECGYIENHEWIEFECCEDKDCSENYFCTHNLCIEKVEPEINTTEEESLESIEELKSMIELAELSLAIEQTETPSLNVTTAQSLLDDAKELLKQAQEAHNNGNYEESQQLAEQAKLLVEKAQEIKAEEQELESDMEEQMDYSGIIYAIALVCIILLGYSLLKGRKK